MLGLYVNAVEKKKFLDASYISQLQSHCNYQKAEQNFNFTKILMHEKSFSGIEVRIHGVLDFSSDTIRLSVGSRTPGTGPVIPGCLLLIWNKINYRRNRLLFLRMTCSGIYRTLVPISIYFPRNKTTISHPEQASDTGKKEIKF